MKMIPLAEAFSWSAHMDEHMVLLIRTTHTPVLAVTKRQRERIMVFLNPNISLYCSHQLCICWVIFLLMFSSSSFVHQMPVRWSQSLIMCDTVAHCDRSLIICSQLSVALKTCSAFSPCLSSSCQHVFTTDEDKVQTTGLLLIKTRLESQSRDQCRDGMWVLFEAQWGYE